jgi:NADPH:quinone reductase-like Zn-dependent oxidoreductase
VLDHLGVSQYPLTPGHELAGIVTAVGANVTKLAVVWRCRLKGLETRLVSALLKPPGVSA